MGVKTIVAGILIAFFIIVVIIGIAAYFVGEAMEKESKKQVAAVEKEAELRERWIKATSGPTRICGYYMIIPCDITFKEYKEWIESSSQPKTEQKPTKPKNQDTKTTYKSQGKCVVSADGLESYCY